MHRHKDYLAHGYTTSDDMDNYGVIIEGVEKGVPASSSDEFKDYMSLFSNSDIFDEATMYCYFN